MEVKPVKQIEKPQYPLKAEFSEDDLKKQVPKRWMQSPAAKIALGTLAVVSLAGCAPLAAGGLMTYAPPTEASESVMPCYVPEVTPTQVRPEGTPAPAMINVAPLFLHGEGRGAFGGDMASMPAFLSEDEALAVINEAAKEYGLKFSSAEAFTFHNVSQPVTDLNPPGEGNESPVPSETLIAHSADFSDIGHGSLSGIAIEFISKDDVVAWSREPSMSTVETYDTKDAAAQLSESLENAYAYGNITAAVLYDPCDFANSEAEARALSKENLKAQAKDFFEWLKSQGVI